MFKRLGFLSLAVLLLVAAYMVPAGTQSPVILFGSFNGAAKPIAVDTNGNLKAVAQSGSSPTFTNIIVNGAVTNPIVQSAAVAGKLQNQFINTSDNVAAYVENLITAGTTTPLNFYFGAEGPLSNDAYGFNRAYQIVNCASASNCGIDYNVLASGTVGSYRWHLDATGSYSASFERMRLNTAGLQLFNLPANITNGTDDTTTLSGDINRTRYQATITPASGGAANCATQAAGFKAANTNADCVIATIPAGSKIVAVYADVTTGFTCSGTCTGTKVFTLGTAAGGSQVFAAGLNVAVTNTQFGLADADLGTGMTRAAAIQGGFLNSWSASTTLTARFTSGTGNWGNASTTFVNAGSIKFTIITEQVK